MAAPAFLPLSSALPDTRGIARGIAGARGGRHPQSLSCSPRQLVTSTGSTRGTYATAFSSGRIIDPNTPFGALIQSFMQIGIQDNSPPDSCGAALRINNVSYCAPGTSVQLLQDISIMMPANRMGLLYGRSGSGKTTLLNAIAGLTEPTSGTIELLSPGTPYSSIDDGRQWSQSERRAAVGMLFQFPERHFLGSTVLEELTFGWPVAQEFYFERQRLATRMEGVIRAVGLQGISYDTRPEELSGGYKRRLALAVQLVRGPRVLLMDEPLAGLDWEARAGIVQLLQKLKKECTLLVVSHDLKELLPIVDVSWEMLPGGRIDPQK